VALALVPGGVREAKADLITFEEHRANSDVSKYQDGFWFTFAAQGWGIYQDGVIGGGAPWVRNGTTRLVASVDLGGSTARVDITREGKPFDFKQFDGARFFPGCSGAVQVIGRVYGGAGTVTASFLL
jgi:hypothetical protein